MSALALAVRPSERRYDGVVDSGTTVLDEQIAASFVQGDESALKTLYDATSRLVYSFCRRSLDPDTAADVTQEIYVAAWRSRQRYRPEAGTITGWLMGIARFKVIDALRSAGRRPTVGDSTVAEMGSPEPGIDDIAQRMLVTEALAQLPDRSRQMVELAFWSDMTHAQIAEQTGVALGTVKSDIRRGLDRLRRHLEGFDASGS
jgi:RNA polymerase sigma-70 factor (ECF subfamily)